MKSYDENKLNELLDYINEYQKSNGKSPSYRFIMKAMNFKSLSAVYRYVGKLEAQNKIKKNDLGGIEISKRLNPAQTILAPLVGSVACGSPILAVENIENTYSLPADIFGKGPTFLLQAKGESMSGAGINNGDFLVVRKCNTADDGDIVIALIDDEATAKRFYRRNNKIILHPENPNFKDIIVDEVRIIGKVISSIHQF